MRPDPQIIPRRYVRSLEADEIARLLDGVDHAEPEVVRRQREFRRKFSAKRERRVVTALILLCCIASIYFIAELLRTATH